jgi:hypothetical protein
MQWVTNIGQTHSSQILFVGSRTTDMPHVDGNDDGVGYGVRGKSNNSYGVVGNSNSGYGVVGDSKNIGVWGWRDNVGVDGLSYTGIGVRSSSYTGWAGVHGYSSFGYGVSGWSVYSIGVSGYSDTHVGVDGYSDSHTGVRGRSYDGAGMRGSSETFIGVYGLSQSGYGVYGVCTSSTGVYGRSYDGYAAFLDGNVKITGNLQKGGGSFKIDHPLDPANKYLAHSFVESPDMKNIYDGVAVLDDKGEAEIELPDWFGALNKDFRYQLTAIGAPGPNLYIAEEIPDVVTNCSNSTSSNGDNSKRFKIAGGSSGMKVSWNVTGIRKDPWANAHRIQVEEDKPDKERGFYLYPDLYDQPTEKGTSHLLFPEEEEKKQELLINENKLPRRKKPQ